MPFYCPGCRKRIKSSDKFCSKCGKDLVHRTVNNLPVVNAVNNIPVANNVINDNSRNNERQRVYEGTVHNCPFCGEIVPSLNVKCPSCGNEFRDINLNSSVYKFSQQLIRLNNQENTIINNNGRNNNNSPDFTIIEKKKIALVQSFPIPNTKEDIVDFLILANSNISLDVLLNESGLQKELAEAWVSKYEQAYQKAIFLFEDQTKIQKIHDDYLKKKERINERINDSYRLDKIGTASTNALIVTFVVCIIFGFILMFIIAPVGLFKIVKNANSELNAENQRLELMLDDINEAINDQDYDKARALTTKLNFNSSYNDEEYVKKWDDKRNEMYEIIDKLEKENAK